MLIQTISKVIQEKLPILIQAWFLFDIFQQPYPDYSSAPVRFEGKILNPAEYQPMQPPAQENYSEKVLVGLL